MQSIHRQQHHRLAPTTAPTNPSVLSSSSNPRLNEFFELIKGEFDAATQDGTVWKAQRDEYESKCAYRLIDDGSMYGRADAS